MKVKAGTVRYIKLGRRGSWEGAALDRGELHFGHRRVPHELALTGDREKIKAFLIKNGREARAAANHAREVVDFYTLGPDCLWVTFARAHMWWTFADEAVTWVGGDGKNTGERLRKSRGG